ncbi:hypothetical protein KKA14_06845, partial [bacterium]|nr:hypothetical protein [bacterium]
MSAAFTCFFFWLLAVCFETTVFASTDWFHPNLLFLTSAIFCLHWRGIEVYFISLLFGLTADCFATTPFGTYGLVYFLFSFFIR